MRKVQRYAGTKRRSQRYTGLAVGLALLVAMIVPAGAGKLPPPPPPDPITCDDIPDAGFQDSRPEDYFYEAVNCLAWYGIVPSSVGNRYFRPEGQLTRWELAFWLARALGYARVGLGDGTSQGFTDIGGLPVPLQIAINQLAAVGITQGTSAATFSPFLTVTRWQMALFLTRALSVAGRALPVPGDQGFTDIGDLPPGLQLAINQLAFLGVVRGVGGGLYAPHLVLSRGWATMFVARLLTYLNAVGFGYYH